MRVAGLQKSDMQTVFMYRERGPLKPRGANRKRQKWEITRS